MSLWFSVLIVTGLAEADGRRSKSPLLSVLCYHLMYKHVSYSLCVFLINLFIYLFFMCVCLFCPWGTWMALSWVVTYFLPPQCFPTLFPLLRRMCWMKENCWNLGTLRRWGCCSGFAVATRSQVGLIQHVVFQMQDVLFQYMSIFTRSSCLCAAVTDAIFATQVLWSSGHHVSPIFSSRPSPNTGQCS